ncbi:ABC transporter permease [Haladaptatus cibarius]|uniref:ABC transporter permease n=1 Tax=Haladaptatus cibarius TaxID=453847 RepID=UPI00067919F6|nr:ABC transporter permease [Haladaptatus cibarius]
MSSDKKSVNSPMDLTFDQVDWSEYQQSRFDLSLTVRTQLAVLGIYAFALLYDSFVIPSKQPTVTTPFIWDISGIDWLFILTLILLFFNVVVPLYENKRMSKYYWSQFRKNKLAVYSLAYLCGLVVVGIVGPLVVSEPKLTFSDSLLPPVGMTAAPQGQVVTGTWEHPLGTNQRGMDILKLMVYGARVSLEVGLIGMLVMITIGTTVGTVAAYFGGTVDEILMRYVDLQMTFPAFMLLLLTVYLFGNSLFIVILLYGFLSWEGTARLVRSEALQRREEPYIEAAESFGASERRIITHHLVPNVSSTVITAATLTIPGFILGEAALSFIGLGDPDVFSWGQVIASGRSQLASAPWIATIPGFFLFFTVLAFNFVGDAARDAIDPRSGE